MVASFSAFPLIINMPFFLGVFLRKYTTPALTFLSVKVINGYTIAKLNKEMKF